TNSSCAASDRAMAPLSVSMIFRHRSRFLWSFLEKPSPLPAGISSSRTETALSTGSLRPPPSFIPYIMSFCIRMANVAGHSRSFPGTTLQLEMTVVTMARRSKSRR
ncbi:hypothetical protein BGZ58_006741, partial [Dissophora ornata]